MHTYQKQSLLTSFVMKTDKQFSTKWSFYIKTVLVFICIGLFSVSCMVTPQTYPMSGVLEIGTAQLTQKVSYSVEVIVSASATQKITATDVLTNTLLPIKTNTSAVLVTPTPEISFPDEYYIENVYGHRQFFSIGCEAAAAVDWARYYGEEIIEYNFQFDIPVSDNPDLGFVGDVRGPWGQAPPYAYGVHAGPLAETLQKYGLDAVAVRDYSLEELKKKITEDKPVIVWVIGNMVGGVPFEYTDSEGNTTIVAAYEHVVIVTGYNSDSIRYLNNGKVYETPIDNFMNSWGVLGNMAVFMGE